MTRWLQAAKRATGEVNTDAGEVLSVLSVLSEGRESQAAQRLQRVELDPNAEAFPFGTACDLGDTPRTWTGRVVSLAAWRRLTEWEKHGPNGRLWCGLCRCWLMPSDCTEGKT